MPSQPIAPTTTWSLDNIIVAWTAPDNGGSIAPFGLIDNTSKRKKSTLGLTWSKADFIGGAEIIDYRVSIAE